MEQEVENADFVLAICTPEFAKKSNSRRGGVGYEQQIVSGKLLSGLSRSRFIPLLRKGDPVSGPACAIPTHFLGTLFIDFRLSDKRVEGLDALLRTIFERPKHTRPDIGPSPFGDQTGSAQNGPTKPGQILVILSDKFEPVGSSLTEAIDDMENLFGGGNGFACKLTNERYSEDLNEYYKLRSITRPSTSERDRRRDLKGRLIAIGLNENFNNRDIDVLEESTKGVDLICRHLRFKRAIIRNGRELERSIRTYLKLVKSSGESQSSTGFTSFDFESPSGHSVVVDFTESETQHLENKVGLDRRHLWSIAGLDFTDAESVGRDAILDRVIPAIVEKFRWLERAGKLIDCEEYFNLNRWKVGLR